MLDAPALADDGFGAPPEAYLNLLHAARFNDRRHFLRAAASGLASA